MRRDPININAAKIPGYSDKIKLKAIISNEKIKTKLLKNGKYNFNITDKNFLIDNKKTAEDYIKEEIYKEKDNNMGDNLKMYINDKGKICISFYTPILNTSEKFTYNTYILNL